MITTVEFSNIYFTFVYEFLHDRDHPIIGTTMTSGIREAFREFRRFMHIPIFGFTIRISKRP